MAVGSATILSEISNFSRPAIMSNEESASRPYPVAAY